MIPPGYKQTEIGVIPEEWEVFNLSEHFRIYAGGDVPKHSVSNIRSDTHPFPIFANALQDRGLYGFTNERRAKADSVTVTARGYLGHAEYRDEPFFPIVRLLVLEPSGALDARFTAVAINERVKFAFESTGVPQLTAPQIGKHSIAAPPLPEQRAIATALSDVDALLAALDRLIAKQRDLKQAAMQQLLTGQTRLPGFTGKWETKRLGDCLLSRPDYGINAAAVPYSDRLPSYIRITDISEHGRYCPDPQVSVNSVNSDQYYLREGDVVFARTGASVGKSYLYEPHDGELVFAGFLIRVRPNPELLVSAFLAAYTTTKPYWSWVRLMSMRSGQPGINGNEFAQLPLLLPPLPEQTAIATVLSDMDLELAALEQRRDKTRALKQGMMQELLTGRTRLL
jgi:type I restriction enzyme S subunit